MKATIDDTGRILLPEDVRLQLGVVPGDEILLEKQGQEWVLRCPRADAGLQWVGNVLVHRGNSTSDAPTETFVEELRKERFDQLTEDLSK